MNKIKVVILSNEIPDDHILWVKACKDYEGQIEFRIVNLTDSLWFRNIHTESFDILLSKPGGYTAPFKQLYDERVYILSKILNYKIFPSADEIFIYENKRFLSSWLEALAIPHPKTIVIYNKYEAEEYIDKVYYPIVGKVNIGASGSGVTIIRSKKEAYNYVKKSFSGIGTPRRVGPNLSKGAIFRRGLNYLKHPSAIVPKLKLYKTLSTDSQKGFVILQEFIPHDFEWRVVRIGDSFFAHKKLKIGDKASGSLLKSYESPPFDLLTFVKEITDRNRFYSQAVDIFESDRGYLVNEMQCIFGQSDQHQMLLNDVSGRFIFDTNQWIFENGSFNENECFNLRVEFIIKLLSSKINLNESIIRM